jgi:hypothetical protein
VLRLVRPVQRPALRLVLRRMRFVERQALRHSARSSGHTAQGAELSSLLALESILIPKSKAITYLLS